MDESCYNCKYWHGGYCCYDPPTVFCYLIAPAIKGSAPTMQGQTVRPRPAGNEWCGKWERKHAKEKGA